MFGRPFHEDEEAAGMVRILRRIYAEYRPSQMPFDCDRIVYCGFGPLIDGEVTW